MKQNGVAPPPAVSLRGVSVSYRGATSPALHDVSLHIPQGQSVAIVGPNGAGKTTLFNTLLGLLPVSRGAVNIFGRAPRLMRRSIAYMPQRDTIDWQFPVTVFDIALMGRIAHIGWRLRPRQSDMAAAQAALERVGMWEKRHRPVGELSGGQQQRLIIARALAQEAPLFLLDEPFNQVDISTQILLLELFEELVAAGRTLLVTTHDLQLAKTRFPQLLFLNRTIQGFGPPEAVFTPEILTRTFSKQVVNWESAFAFSPNRD